MSDSYFSREWPRWVTLLLLAAGSAAPATWADETVVGGAAFRGQESYLSDYSTADGFAGSTLGYSSYAPEGCLSAPVDFERLATIRDFSADLYDNDAGGNFSVQLRRHSFLDPAASYELIAEVATTGAGTAIVRISAPSISHPFVDLSQYSYYLTTPDCLGAGDDDHRIYAVRITSDVPIFADGFETGDVSGWGVIWNQYIRSFSGASFFIADSDNTGNYADYIFHPDEGYLRPDTPYNPGVGTRCDRAAVVLPDGAAMYQMDGALYDESTTADLTVNLRRKAYTNTSASTVIASLTTSGNSTDAQYPTSSVTQPTVDNLTYTYYFEVCNSVIQPFQSELLRIYNVRIKYTR